MGQPIPAAHTEWNRISTRTAKLGVPLRLGVMLPKYKLEVMTFLYTKVNPETLEMSTGKWGHCRDERTVILDNEAKGFYCPIPFAYNYRYYDKCTRNPSPQKAIADPNSLEELYWCAPGDFHSDGDVSTQTGMGGLCDEYLYPAGLNHVTKTQTETF